MHGPNGQPHPQPPNFLNGLERAASPSGIKSKAALPAADKL